VNLQETLGEVSALLKLGIAFMPTSLMTFGGAYLIRIFLRHEIGLEAVGLYQSAWMLCGLAYKPNVDNDRESPTYELYGPFQTARRGGGLLRSFCAGDSHDPRTSVLGRDAVGKLGSQNNRKLRCRGHSHQSSIRQLQGTGRLGGLHRGHAKSNGARKNKFRLGVESLNIG
jgi:hypothetical protein